MTLSEFTLKISPISEEKKKYIYIHHLYLKSCELFPEWVERNLTGLSLRQSTYNRIVCDSQKLHQHVKVLRGTICKKQTEV